TEKIVRNSGNINVDQCTEQIGLSRRRIEQVFLEYTGLTISQFIIKIRVHNALRILSRRNDLSLTQIGLISGFYDQSHFIRCFKQYCGFSPSRYKMAHNSLVQNVTSLTL